MARDEAQEEREFLADLQARSGRDLAGWMAAISAQGFTDKNDAIDWLRTQGFPFARASWLERIHSNSGRPIYFADGTLAEQPRRQQPPPAPVSAPTSVQRPPAAAGDARAKEELVAAAKGYRPLYMMLEAAILRAVPGAAFVASGQYISVRAPGEFAAIAPSATEIRLGLDLGDRPQDANLSAPRIRGVGPSITHMMVLKDARQINAETIALVTAAHARVAPGGSSSG